MLYRGRGLFRRVLDVLVFDNQAVATFLSFRLALDG